MNIQLKFIMKDFVNPFENRKYRNKPWFHLRAEETSYIIYNAFRMNFLKSDDVSSFLKAHKLNCLSFFSYPLIAAFPVYKLISQYQNKFRFFNHSVLRAYTVLGVAASWILFNSVNPLRNNYESEKLKVLNYLDSQMSYEMVKFNAMLPRYWTDGYVNQMTNKLYKQRNCKCSWLRVPEASTNVMISPDEYDITNETRI